MTNDGRTGFIPGGVWNLKTASLPGQLSNCLTKENFWGKDWDQ